MAGYFIKKHYKTNDLYPGEDGLHFSRRAYAQAEAFSSCQGFLLYETKQGDPGSLKGSGTLYGYGHPIGKPDYSSSPRVANGQTFPYSVAIIIEGQMTDRTKGISLDTLRKKYGINMCRILGGIVPVNEDIFLDLKKELVKRIREESKA
ncbi:hypothetical protein [Candidatus Formimonas warabiya]|uniref:Uncharacterized protein n=1 Tax=Formimonas warabiya TaxID=1761012 RepID=A0A3G1KQ16_FORW1|nr:hypothetical protein [Candidatus Formimonas warabiya]ATW24569.1 hypothetical protein DCMF_07020 [Candidatus Formimonas warabiya]